MPQHGHGHGAGAVAANRSNEQAFTNIYSKHLWGKYGKGSGQGSEVDYASFAIVINATEVVDGTANVVELLMRMLRGEPERVAALQAGVRRVAPFMRIAPEECPEDGKACDAFSMFIERLRRLKAREPA